MATTRLVSGVLREFWRRDDAQGAGAANIDTNIRISAGQLSRVQGFLAITNVAGVPTFVVGTSIVNGRLRVTVTNGGGGTGTWDLDVALVPSTDQGKRAGASYIMVTNGTPGLVGPQTLAQTYLQGAASADQTMVVTQADGGAIIVDAEASVAGANPSVALEVRQNGADLGPWPLLLSRFGDFANPAALYFEKSRGTFALPADVQNNDMLGCIDFFGRVGGVMSLQPGSQIISHVAGVMAGLEGVLSIWTSSAGVSTRIVIFDHQAAGSPRIALDGTDGAIVPSLNTEGHLGVVAAAWNSAYIYTVNVAANICMDGIAAAGGANLTIALTNGATMPVPQANQVYLGAADWLGDGGAGGAALAISSEELVADTGGQPDTLIPIVFNGVPYYVLAIDRTPQG